MTGLFNLLRGSVGVIAIWFAVATMFIGIGLGLRRLLGVRRIDTDSMLLSFWIGFSVAIAALQLWHLVAPVTWMATAVIGATGAVGMAISLPELRGWLAGADWAKRKWWLVAIGSVVLWSADWAMGPCSNWDSGVYHAAMVRWIGEYPIVPGLGNLHGRFAFNNAGLLYYAALNVGPFRGFAYHFAVQLLYLAFAVQVVLSMCRLRSTVGDACSPKVFDTALLVPVAWVTLNQRGGCLTNDFATGVVLLVTASLVFRLLVRPPSDFVNEAFETATAVTLSATAVCLKLSALVFGTGLGAVAVGAWWWRHGRVPRRPPSLAWGAGLSALLLLTWMVRGGILSGFPLYPSTILSLPVDWRVPVEQAEAETAFTIHFAHVIDATARVEQVDAGSPDVGLAWLAPWARGLLVRQSGVVSIIVPSLLSLVAWCAWLTNAHRGRAVRGGLWLLAPAGIGTAFWIVTAPAGRFGFFMFWTMAATLVACAGSSYLGKGSPRVTWMTLVATVVASLLIWVPRGMAEYRASQSLLRAVARMVLLPPPSHWMEPLPLAKLKTYTTDSGLALKVTIGRDQRCWDAEPPCTPYPAPNLSLRQAGRLGSGFRIEGPWRVMDWPAAGRTFLQDWRTRRSGRLSGATPVPARKP